MKKLLVYFAFALFVLGCSKEDSLQKQSISPVIHNPAMAKSGNSASSQQTDVINGVTGDLVGTAHLVRNKNGIKVTFTANDLTPGFAYTLWWVIWNRPENCANPHACGDDLDFGNPDVGTEVLYAGGHVVGASGKGSFSGHLNEGSIKGSINDIFGLPPAEGLENAMHAEVHAVLRNHGPAVPGEVNAQINSYPGGCEVDLGLFMEIPDEVGECADTHFAIFSSPNAP
ncbi:MAG: hypothetical protein HKN76_14630 [Saprospiraceae bacterium]|nr:hypothetical protein [Saprospiraceae bacterium]